MKTCSACKQSRLLADFNKRAASRDGLAASCKQCTRERNQLDYRKDKLEYIERADRNERLRKDADPIFKNAWNSWRQLKKLNRVPRWISFSKDILPAYRRLLKGKVVGVGGWVVDHKIPVNGSDVSGLHTPSNLHAIKWSANSVKSNTFNDDLLRACDY